uniref:Peptidase C1A papain C-terminal domain-containing protein n=1 Tax=Haptolina brevifila TaxID=156173 RepID=A0A7S2IQV0_9EUKA|mmetsp:Transcript_69998/g.138791  ORF Transcript_69998/g.138791 Transcript_69998/m.138791 type:complete len:370 (+) Transcript_69998:107-1216(+)
MFALATAASLSALLAGERSDLSTYTFEAYVSEFGKSYATVEEHASRAAIFADNVAQILEHNSQRDKTWFMTINHFADMTNAEFKKARTGRAKTTKTFTAAPHFHTPLESLPDTLDWRTKEGVVTKAKDQGGCGSCWAFSATETLESAAALASGEAAPILSPQQIVSCSPNPQHCGGTGGCDGSTQELAFQYTETAGIVAESDYPYEGITGTCKQSKIGSPVVKNNGFVKLPGNNYTALMNAVATVGPIAISVAAGSMSWQFYGGGVYSGNRCGWDEDHAVGLVGYGKKGTKDYWIVRNSWGVSWGDEGFMYLERFGEGKEPCGMDDTPLDGGACAGDTKPEKLCGACGILSDSSYPTGVKMVKATPPTA